MVRATLLVVASIALLAVAQAAAAAPSSSLGDMATEIANMACPYAMMQSYGCPIETNKTLRSAEAGCTGGAGEQCTGSAADIRSKLDAEQHWSIGSVPVGVGFDTVSMKVMLPFYYPAGESKHVFDINVVNETYTTIEDYIGSMSPTAMKALMTGALSSDINHVYKTFFGSYSWLHRTTQVDIITKANLTNSPEMLPRVEAAVNYLPAEYDYNIYSEFIRYWGTHVVTRAAIGGACEQLTSVKSCFASGQASLVQNQAQLEMARKTLQDPTGEKMNQAYVEFSRSEDVTMYGGDPAYFKPSQWTQREKSIAEAPVLIRVDEMKPISECISDATKAANMKRAVAEYQENAHNARIAAAAAAKAAEVFKVTAATTVDFSDVQMSFTHHKWHCHHIHIGHWGCHCEDTTACFHPGNCGTGCGAGTTATQYVSEQPTAELHRGKSATMSPDGSKSCSCGHYSNYETPAFPLNNLDQQFTCEINADGEVRASNVQNPGWEPSRVGGAKKSIDGEWVRQGCSIAKAEYTGSAWRMTGGAESHCGAVTNTMGSSGSFTANGWCCAGTTLAAVSSDACFGTFDVNKCLGF